MWKDDWQEKDVFSGNTTIGCVVTNGKLTKDQCAKLASMCHDGYASAIKPVHSSADWLILSFSFPEERWKSTLTHWAISAPM